MTERRGYAWIALERPKTDSNVGGALRASHVFGASGVILAAPRFAQFRRETRQPPVCSTSSVISEEYPAMNAPKVGHNSAVNATERMAYFMTRLNENRQRLDDCNAKKAAVYAEARTHGYDAAAIKECIRLRRAGDAEALSPDGLVDVYRRLARDLIQPAAAVSAKSYWAALHRRPTPPDERFATASVYFAVDDETGVLKIGVSNNVLRRLSKIAQASGRAVRLLGTIPGNRAVETAMHQRFAHVRIRGEWFRATDDVLAEIMGIVGLPARQEAA